MGHSQVWGHLHLHQPAPSTAHLTSHLHLPMWGRVRVRASDQLELLPFHPMSVSSCLSMPMPMLDNGRHGRVPILQTHQTLHLTRANSPRAPGIMPTGCALPLPLVSSPGFLVFFFTRGQGFGERRLKAIVPLPVSIAPGTGWVRALRGLH